MPLVLVAIDGCGYSTSYHPRDEMMWNISHYTIKGTSPH